jgi:WD40 repeat protein
MSGVFQSYLGPYTLAARLNGHSDAIYSLAVSPSREFLSSGGKSMLSIRHHTSRLFFSTKERMDFESGISRVTLRSLGCQETDHNMALSPAWCGRHVGEALPTSWHMALASVTLEFGDNLPQYVSCRYIIVGFLTSLQGSFEGVVGKRVGHGKEIICLSSDTSGPGPVSRLALGARDGVVQAFAISSTGEMSSIFSVVIQDVVPISVSFTDDPAKDVIIIGMHCGHK